jgi:ketosteroid isomerase-like protein
MKRLFLMFVVTFAFAGFALGECSDSDRKVLEAFDRAWGDAGEKGDRNALMAILADDYTGLPAMQNKMQNIEAAIATAEYSRANPNMADKVSHDNYLISCTPGSAVITHRNIVTTKIGAGGKEETFWTRSVHMLEKRSGKWQVVGNAGNNLDDAAVLVYMELDWNNADKNRDTGWFERNFATDYSSVSSRNGKLSTKAEDIADSKADKRVVESIDLSDVNVRIDRNTAVVTGVNHVLGRDDKGQPMDYRSRFTDTFIKRDGRWQAWATQGTRIP